MADQAEILAPNSIEAEEALLGSILINPDSLYDIGPHITENDFFVVRNQWIYEAILAVHDRGEAIDVLTVIVELRNRNQLDQIGGPAYITQLIDRTPTHIHAETYAAMIGGAAVRRQIMAVAAKIAQTALEANERVEDVIDRCEQLLYSVTTRRTNAPVFIRSVASKHYDVMEARKADRLLADGYETGFTELDSIIGGLRRKKSILVGARPGVGKTSFILNLIPNLARQGARIMLASLEMDEIEIMDRLYSAEMEIQHDFIQRSTLPDDQWDRYMAQTSIFETWPVALDCSFGQSIISVRGKARQMKRQYGLDVLFVDYVGRLISGREEKNRIAEMSFISGQLKDISIELDCTVISAIQLTRESVGRKDHIPQLEDLRDSGSFEQDADMVWFPHRPHYFDKSADPTQADIIVAKHRGGRTGPARVGWHGELTKFKNPNPAYIDFS